MTIIGCQHLYILYSLEVLFKVTIHFSDSIVFNDTQLQMVLSITNCSFSNTIVVVGLHIYLVLSADGAGVFRERHVCMLIIVNCHHILPGEACAFHEHMQDHHVS